MPVAIACPKCQTRYSLPDQALGKPVKCKSCGAVFKTNAPPPKAAAQPVARQPQAQQPAKPASPQQPAAQASNAELAKYGIDGPIGRPADIFAGTSAPPPQMGNPLGNFVLEDPGFADLNVVHDEVQQEMGHDDGMSAIINNPYLTSSSATTQSRKRAEIDLSGYAVARVGMWMVYVAWGLTLGITIFFAVFGTIVRVLPEDTLISIAQSLGPTVGQILVWIVFVFLWIGVISTGVIFIGQILCIFSPNNDEKLFAGLTVGSILGAFTLFVIMIFMGGFAGFVGNDQQTAQAVLGVFMLLAILGIYALLLASMFFFMTYFKRIGKNIKSRDVVESAKTAMITWVAAIAIGIISSVATGILIGIYAAEDAEFVGQVTDIVGLVNVFLIIAVMGTLLMMVRSAIDGTRAR